MMNSSNVCIQQPLPYPYLLHLLNTMEILWYPYYTHYSLILLLLKSLKNSCVLLCVYLYFIYYHLWILSICTFAIVIIYWPNTIGINNMLLHIQTSIRLFKTDISQKAYIVKVLRISMRYPHSVIGLANTTLAL